MKSFPSALFNIKPFLIYYSFILLAICSEVCRAEEECLGRNSINCYECESKKDPRCADPFNQTAYSSDESLYKTCQGCCVKIVMNKNTAKQSVRRTCTQNIQINLFMVDHVCMEESDGQGHMCFCESDKCNASTPRFSPSTRLILLLAILSVFHQLYSNHYFYSNSIHTSLLLSNCYTTHYRSSFETTSLPTDQVPVIKRTTHRR